MPSKPSTWRSKPRFNGFLFGVNITGIIPAAFSHPKALFDPQGLMVGQEDRLTQAMTDAGLKPTIALGAFVYHFKSVTVSLATKGARQERRMREQAGIRDSSDPVSPPIRPGTRGLNTGTSARASAKAGTSVAPPESSVAQMFGHKLLHFPTIRSLSIVPEKASPVPMKKPARRRLEMNIGTRAGTTTPSQRQTVTSKKPGIPSTKGDIREDLRYYHPELASTTATSLNASLPKSVADVPGKALSAVYADYGGTINLARRQTLSTGAQLSVYPPLFSSPLVTALGSVQRRPVTATETANGASSVRDRTITTASSDLLSTGVAVRKIVIALAISGGLLLVYKNGLTLHRSLVMYVLHILRHIDLWILPC
jgi:hypothetical protein